MNQMNHMNQMNCMNCMNCMNYMNYMNYMIIVNGIYIEEPKYYQETDDSLSMNYVLFLKEQSITHKKNLERIEVKSFSWGTFYDYDSSPSDQFLFIGKLNY